MALRRSPYILPTPRATVPTENSLRDSESQRENRG